MVTDVRTRLEHRYGGDVALDLDLLNETIASQLAHRSVRDYSDRKLPDGTLDVLVAAAQSASTSANLQAWSIVAVQSQATKDRLAALARGQKHIREAPLFIVWVVDFSRASRLAGPAGTDLEVLEHVESVLLGAVDTALAAQNAVVALESLGLASVYIGGIRNDAAEVIRLLNLPRHTFPLFGLCVGYADPTKPAQIKPRLPQHVVVHQESYSVDNERQRFEDYDGRLQGFYQGQGLEPTSWTSLVLKRLRSSDELHGRERLAAVLRAQGFGFR